MAQQLLRMRVRSPTGSVRKFFDMDKYLTLDRASGATYPPTSPEDSDSTAAPSGGGSILVVQIDREYRERLQRALLSGRIVAIGTSSELKALELLRAGGLFDAMLIEARSADSDGLTLLRQVRRQRPGMPVVVLLSEDDSVRRAQNLAQGAFCCATRSTEVATVAAMLRVAIQQSRLARQSGVYALHERGTSGYHRDSAAIQHRVSTR